MRLLFVASLVSLYAFSVSYSQDLPTHWEALTAADFPLAVQKAEGVCVIPLGVIEKHGPHLPLGTDMYRAREICDRAAAEEYCIVFPYYFQGQILEAKHQPGTIAYSSDLMLKLLDETCKEISRNGMKKIIIVNSHGGNNSFLQYFSMIQLESPRDYAVYVITPSPNQEIQRKIREMRKTNFGGHADEVETSSMLAIRPDLVKMDRASDESGRDKGQLGELPYVFTGIKWYSSYPNHYAGDAQEAVAELGELALGGSSQQLVEIIKAVKADQTTLRLQNEFYQESQSPLDTKAQ